MNISAAIGNLLRAVTVAWPLPWGYRERARATTLISAADENAGGSGDREPSPDPKICEDTAKIATSTARETLKFQGNGRGRARRLAVL